MKKMSRLGVFIAGCVASCAMTQAWADAASSATEGGQANTTSQIQALEQRISELEKAQTERGDQLASSKAARRFDELVDIEGYFRAGYGRNNQGGPQIGFQAPGALTKFRLGNEAENFGELILGKGFYLSSDAQGNNKGPVAKVNVRLDFFNAYDDFSSAESTNVGLPEAWVSMGALSQSQPDLTVWAGNRFYRRQSSDINDFFYWNMSGGGFGVEDIHIGGVKAALAWIGSGATSGFSNLPQPDPENKAGFSKTNIDFRLYDIALLKGNVEFGVVYSRAKSGLDANGNQADDTDGYAIHVVHKVDGFISEDGYHNLSLQYGTEAAKSFTSGFETFSLGGGNYIQPDLSGSSRVRITESFAATVNDRFSVMPALVYQKTDYGRNIGSQTWVSAGVRPIVHFNQRFSLAFEPGVDYVKDVAGTSDKLYKFTIAPQISLGGRYGSRPVIRAFATWAKWGDEFVGEVGGLDYANKNSGLTMGVQMDVGW